MTKKNKADTVRARAVFTVKNEEKRPTRRVRMSLGLNRELTVGRVDVRTYAFDSDGTSGQSKRYTAERLTYDEIVEFVKKVKDIIGLPVDRLLEQARGKVNEKVTASIVKQLPPEKLAEMLAQINASK